MKRLLTTLLLLGSLTMGYSQEGYGEDLKVSLWNNQTAPHSNGLEGPEEVLASKSMSKTTEAELYLFRANPERATGQAVVICPGGAYIRLAMVHEGAQIAQWLAGEGITAAVLKYRIPNGVREVPLEDAEKALNTMKEQASEWGFDADKVGIAGCSAGGHLAAMTSTMGAVRPAFSILFYPVITGEEGRCHRGSFDNLLGKERTAEESRRYWLEERVDSLTPPALLLLSDDDTAVPPISSTRYYNALKEQGIKASIHIYPSGKHGWGMRDSFPYKEQWQEAVLDWLKSLQ